MNKERRSKIAKALELIDNAKTILEEVKDEEESCYDNLPDNLRESEKGETMQENVNDLNECIDYLDDMSNLSDM